MPPRINGVIFLSESDFRPGLYKGVNALEILPS